MYLASLEEHCEQSRRELGAEFREVHIWLDAFAKDYEGGFGHRDFRHNLEGVEIVRSKWGNEAAKAAILHILTDWHGQIIENEIPKNMAGAIKLRIRLSKHTSK